MIHPHHPTCKEATIQNPPTSLAQSTRFIHPTASSWDHQPLTLSINHPQSSSNDLLFLSPLAFDSNLKAPHPPLVGWSQPADSNRLGVILQGSVGSTYLPANLSSQVIQNHSHCSKRVWKMIDSWSHNQFNPNQLISLKGSSYDTVSSSQPSTSSLLNKPINLEIQLEAYFDHSSTLTSLSHRWLGRIRFKRLA